MTVHELKVATLLPDGKLANRAVIEYENEADVETALTNARERISQEGGQLVITGFGGPDVPELRVMASELNVPVLKGR